MNDDKKDEALYPHYSLQDNVCMLNLSVRTTNILNDARNGPIRTIADVAKFWGDQMLAQWVNCGRYTVRELREELWRAGQFKLADGLTPSEAAAQNPRNVKTRRNAIPAAESSVSIPIRLQCEMCHTLRIEQAQRRAPGESRVFVLADALEPSALNAEGGFVLTPEEQFKGG